MLYWIELSRPNFQHNIYQINRLTNNRPIAIVAKGNAYGHGMRELISLAQETASITWLCVAGIEEAIMARQCGWYKDILVMAYHDADYKNAHVHNLVLAVYNYEQIRVLAQYAKKNNMTFRVHIKIDTGMSRLGIASQQTLAFFQRIKEESSLHIEGIFTHLSDTQNADPTFSEQQIQTFEKITEQLARAGYYVPLVHSVASGMLHHQTRSDIVRVGTALYGMWKNTVRKKRFHAHLSDIDFKQVLSLYTVVIKKIYYQGFWCGILPIGLDNIPLYPRRGAFVAISSQLYAVLEIQRTHMIVRLPEDCSLGTQVQLIGESPSLTVDYLATLSGVISNEFLATLSEKIQRVIV